MEKIFGNDFRKHGLSVPIDTGVYSVIRQVQLFLNSLSFQNVSIFVSETVNVMGISGQNKREIGFRSYFIGKFQTGFHKSRYILSGINPSHE